MAKVIGIGGVFFKSAEWATVKTWYQEVLGVDIAEWGGAFFTPDMLADSAGAGTVFAGFAPDTDYFAPSTKDYMINLIVDDLDAVLERLSRHGVAPARRLPDEPNGRFAHILDPEGRKIELWEPQEMTQATAPS